MREALLSDNPPAQDLTYTNTLDREFMEKILALIDECMEDPEFSINNLCTKLGMSRSSLYNKLKALTDQAPNDFIRIIRLLDDKQRTLLEAGRGIGGRLSQNDAARLTRALVSAELLTQREGQLLLSACSDGALAEVDKTDRDRLRSAIFRCAVMGVATV